MRTANARWCAWLARPMRTVAISNQVAIIAEPVRLLRPRRLASSPTQVKPPSLPPRAALARRRAFAGRARKSRRARRSPGTSCTRSPPCRAHTRSIRRTRGNRTSACRLAAWHMRITWLLCVASKFHEICSRHTPALHMEPGPGKKRRLCTGALNAMPSTKFEVRDARAAGRRAPSAAL